MSTRNENTLQIKSFRGVNRFAKGTVTPPDEAYELKNLHPISRGQMQAIRGCEVMNQTIVIDPEDPPEVIPLPGVGTIVSTEFFTDAYGQTKLLTFFKLDEFAAPPIPDVTASNFSSFSSSGADTLTFLVTYVGPGGTVNSLAVDIGSLSEANSDNGVLTFTFTTPATVPDFIAQIDVYVISGALTGLYGWCGSLHRTMDTGDFPASMVCRTPLSYSIATQTAAPKVQISNVRANGAASANTRKVYIGVSPHVAQLSGPGFGGINHPRINMVDNKTPFSFLACDVPETGGRVEICFPYAPPTLGGDIDFNATPLRAYVPFWGTTIEDLLAAWPEDAGKCVPVAPTSIQYNIDSVSAGTDTLTLTKLAGDSVQTGDQVVYVGATGGGLTSNTVYYLRIVEAASRGSGIGVRLYATQANFEADTAVDITALPAGDLYFTKIYFDVESVYNSRNGVQMVQDYETNLDAPMNQTVKDWQAIASRTEGAFRNAAVAVPPSGATDAGKWADGFSITASDDDVGHELTDYIGCWVIGGSSFSLLNSYQLLINVNERTYTPSLIAVIGSPQDQMLAPGYFTNPRLRAVAFDQNDEAISFEGYFNRGFMANGDNQPYYTNGFVWKVAMPNDGTAPLPTGKYIETINERLACAGGRESQTNSPNQVFYSEAGTPFNWGTTINSFNCFSPQPINGLGAYSQNLADTGFNAYLLVSKRDGLFIWENPTNGPREIYNAFGFAGPRSFSVSNFGPIFLSRFSAYTVQGDRLLDVGEEFRDIIQTLNDDQLQRVEATYHDRKTKFAYPSDPESLLLDREIWCEFRLEGGELAKFWSGPHEILTYGSQAATIEFDGVRDYRVAGIGQNVYRMDVGYLDAALADLHRKAVYNRLGLNADHFWKLLTQVYLAVEISQDETFTITLEAEDGTVTPLVLSKTGTFATAAHQLLQAMAVTRFQSRITSLTIENTSDGPVSLFDISLLFETQRRRLLGGRLA